MTDSNYVARARVELVRALVRHLDRCPTAASLRGAVAMRWTADIEER
jgi:hypothetical protein